jgi:predicted small secreted protein
MKKLLGVVSMLTVFVLVAPGCNTVKGAGKDLQVAGEKGQQLIDRNSR